MKKTLIIVGALVLVLGVGLLVVPLFFLNSIVKKGFETIGPKVAKVETRLESANLSLFYGSGQLKGVFVGNPEGFTTPSAIQVGEVTVALDPRSVFSDKVVIRSIAVTAPEITIEGLLQKNNLKKITENVMAVSGASSTGATGQTDVATTKVQIDEFALTGARVNLTSGVPGTKSIPLTIPDIRLSGLGTGPEGITGAEVAKRVLNELMIAVTPVVAQHIGELGQDAAKAAAGKLGPEASKQLENVSKGLGDLLKKKN